MPLRITHHILTTNHQPLLPTDPTHHITTTSCHIGHSTLECVYEMRLAMQVRFAYTVTCNGDAVVGE